MINVVAFIVVCMLAALPCTAHATLIGVSESLVFDDLTSRYWYRNISDFSGGTGGVDEALEWIPQNFNGLNTWRLASREEANTMLAGTTVTDFLNYFQPTGIYNGGAPPDLGIGPTGNYKYWVGGTDSFIFLPGTSLPLALNLYTVRVNFASNDSEQLTAISMEFDLGGAGPQWLRLSEVGAWLTASGPPPGSGEPAPVPEPSTILLLAAAMVGCACVSLVRQK